MTHIAKTLLAELRREISLFSDIVDPDEYVDKNILDPSTTIGFSTTSIESDHLRKKLESSGSSVLLLFNRFLLCNLLYNFDIRNTSLTLPDSITSKLDNELQRILQRLSDDKNSSFSFDNDWFLKDLAILTHRFIPVGAEFVTPNSGIPRSILIRGGARQILLAVRTLISVGGTSPFLSLHMHPLSKEMFNPDGWIHTYECLADLLELNPEILGVQSTSWFLDPKLDQISPHLTYLRQVPERCGARFFFMGFDHDGKSGALSTSKNRRALFEQKAYTPALYMRVWPRKNILERKWRSLNSTK